MDNRKLLFVGGDKRRLYTERYFSSKGYETVSFEADREKFFEALNGNCTVILPLPFSRDNIRVNNSEMSIAELLNKLKSGDKVIGGILTQDFKSELSKRKVKALDYYCEDMVLENAQLTADALFEVFSENGININCANSVITGFGRTAKAIAHRLLMRDVDFSIAARSEAAEKDAVSMGLNYVKLSSLTDKIHEFDIVINTVPALILDESILKKANKNTVIVDIASAPFGVEESTAEKHGIKLIRALGLPGKYYSEKAGELIGKKAESLL